MIISIKKSTEPTITGGTKVKVCHVASQFVRQPTKFELKIKRLQELRRSIDLQKDRTDERVTLEYVRTIIPESVQEAVSEIDPDLGKFLLQNNENGSFFRGQFSDINDGENMVKRLEYMVPRKYFDFYWSGSDAATGRIEVRKNWELREILTRLKNHQTSEQLQTDYETLFQEIYRPRTAIGAKPSRTRPVKRASVNRSVSDHRRSSKNFRAS